MTPEEFMEWLDKEVEFIKPTEDYKPSEYERGYRKALVDVKNIFLTLTPPPTTLS